MKRRVCVITGTRAEYGLLRWVMEEIRNDHDMELQIIATGSHLSPEFGLTYREIETDGFRINRKIEMLMSSDSHVGVGKSMGLGMIGFSDGFQDLQPDLVLVLGDRFEVFAAVAAALVARIPVAHIHGGEKTEGAFDDALRHSITKMSHLHFVAAEEYRNRVIQLGESPENVFLVGGLGVDGLLRTNLLGREELEAEIGFRFGPRNLLVTFHPVTLDSGSSSQMAELLAALADLQGTHLIFTLPNADTESRGLIRMIEDFVAKHSNAKAFTSLGQLRYLSCLAQVDGVVGNSSSGLLEAPTLKKGTVNIGDRQKGRLTADSVINCGPDRKSIGEALVRLYSQEFQSKLAAISNPYGNGGASRKVASIISQCSLTSLVKKKFHDLPGTGGGSLSEH
jgi:GDP/UDP-N,N'-diacetylbacillosamine 2-epimerase (hydrolysing)